MKYVDLGSIKTLNKKPRKKSKKIVFGVFFILFFLIFIFLVRKQGFSSLFNPISIVSSILSDGLNETDGRTNFLIGGLDRRSQSSSAGLTDTLMVASYNKSTKSAVIISLPRDLWVKSKSGNYSKINAVYANYGKDELKSVIESVLNVPIHYYVIVDFSAFEKAIDTLGGVDVNVETTFDDYYYPVEGKENAEPESERYMKVHFDAGLQRMDSKTALIFSRSRKGTNNEGTDFARAKRQQKVILAIRDKILSAETLFNPVKLKELYENYKDYVETSISLKEVQSLLNLAKSSDVTNVKSIVLDDRSTEDSGGLLYEPEDKTLYGGQYVLIPKAGDYSQIHAHIAKLLFGE